MYNHKKGTKIKNQYNYEELQAATFPVDHRQPFGVIAGTFNYLARNPLVTSAIAAVAITHTQGGDALDVAKNFGMIAGVATLSLIAAALVFKNITPFMDQMRGQAIERKINGKLVKKHKNGESEYTEGHETITSLRLKADSFRYSHLQSQKIIKNLFSPKVS